jgi:hypothetical protein
MRAIADRTVIETLTLDDCAKGDELEIRYSHMGSWKSIGEGTLEKVKPLPKGGHQIKFRSSWPGSTVQKHDVPAGITVTRRRAPTGAELAADPSLAPVPERKTAVRDGVRYIATDPSVDLEAALDRAMDRTGAITRDMMPKEMTERHLELGMHAFGLAATSLGLASLLSGARLVRADD